ncbi:MAG: tetratricopeptide repeat protein [Armatimonadota bacterium]
MKVYCAGLAGILLAACALGQPARGPSDQAIALLMAGQYEEALPLLRQAAAADPGQPALRLYVIVALVSAGKAEEAVTEAEQWLAERPQEPLANAGYAAAASAAGRLDEAIGEAETLLAADPDDAIVHLRLGRLLTHAGADSGAVLHCKEAARLRPDEFLHYYYLAEALIRAGMPREGYGQLRAGLEADTRYDMTLEPLEVEALVQEHAFEGKVPESLELARLYPKSPEAHLNLGRALAADGQEQAAISEVQVALELDPNDFDALLYLATVLSARRDYAEALRTYDRLLANYAANPDAHVGKGWVLHRQERLDEAVVEYRSALDADPKNYEAHYRLSQALDQSGRTAEALEELWRAVSLRPAKATIRGPAGVFPVPRPPPGP